MNPITHFLASRDFLDWWLLAAIFSIADLFLPRARLVAAAWAAGLVGFMWLLFPGVAWPAELPVFAVVAAVLWIAYRGRWRSAQSGRETMANFHDFSIRSIDGSPMSLRDYCGKPVLVVNVASECGLTPQYAGLEKLYREFRDRGLVVLGLPCNQFGAQEPGSEAEIRQFCDTNYGVDFPLGAKLEVNGANSHPLYTWLKGATGGGDIQWNFEKFLIDRDGRTVRRYSPKTTPEDKQLRADIQAAL